MAANVTTIPGATEKDIYLGNYTYANILAHMDILRFKLATDGSNRIFYKNASGDLFKVAVEAVGAANHPDKRIPYTDALGVYQSSADLTWDAGLIVGTLTASQIVETNAAKKLVSAAKATAYNKAFGTGAGTVAEGNHLHTGVYEPSFAAGTTAQYRRGDKTWQTLNTAAVPELTNLYYTDARARLALSASSPLAYNNSTGALTHLDTAGNKHVPTGTTDRVPYWSASGILSASPVYTNGSRVGIGGEPDASAAVPLLVQNNGDSLVRSSAYSDTGNIYGGLEANAYDADFASNRSRAILMAYTSGATGTSFFGLNRAGITVLRFLPNNSHAGIGTASATDLILGTNDTERVRIYADGKATFKEQLTVNKSLVCNASLVVGTGGETQGTAVSINTTDRFYISVAPTGPDPELFNYQLTGGEDGQIIFVINKGSYQAYLHGADRIFLGDRAIYRRESGTWEKMAAMDA